MKLNIFIVLAVLVSFSLFGAAEKAKSPEQDLLNLVLKSTNGDTDRAISSLKSMIFAINKIQDEEDIISERLKQPFDEDTILELLTKYPYSDQLRKIKDEFLKSGKIVEASIFRTDSAGDLHTKTVRFTKKNIDAYLKRGSI